MYIRVLDGSNILNVASRVFEHIMLNTRFEIGKFEQKSKNVWVIAQVRLKDGKHWCGAHPNSCELRPNRGREMKKSRLLEGLDWVEFNDHINDVLDEMCIEARVWSTYVPVEIRDGRCRRINYGSYEFNDRRGLWEWEKEGIYNDYADYCGRIAPASTYPEGTPGEYRRVVNASSSAGY